MENQKVIWIYMWKLRTSSRCPSLLSWFLCRCAMCCDGQSALSLSPHFRCSHWDSKFEWRWFVLMVLLIIWIWICIFLLFKFWVRAKVVWMQVIALTEELLATAKQNDISGSDIGTSGRASPSLPHSKMVIPHLFHLFLCLVTWQKKKKTVFGCLGLQICFVSSWRQKSCLTAIKKKSRKLGPKRVAMDMALSF